MKSFIKLELSIIEIIKIPFFYEFYSLKILKELAP